MDDMKRKELAASEVIGAVLIVSLVVIGGAVVAAMVFGQPTPKEMPNVDFGVSMEDYTLTLHHTGGDTLLPNDYRVLVDGVDRTGDIPERIKPWSSGGDLSIPSVTQTPGTVVLTYLDQASGETVLRKVPFADYPPVDIVGVISGTKYKVTADPPHKEIIGTVSGIEMTLYRKVAGPDPEPVGTPATTGADGTYSFTLPANQWGTYWVEETGGLDGWEKGNPKNGKSNQFEITRDDPIEDGVDFRNYRSTPTTNPAISITKVTSDGTNEGDDLTIPEDTPITWKYTITNIGNVALTGITLHDDKLGSITLTDTVLPPGELMTVTRSGIAVAGDYTNTGTVTGEPPTGPRVTASDSSSYTGTRVIPPTTTISGRKWRVNTEGEPLAFPGAPGITITLDLVTPTSIRGFTFPLTTVTDANGYYSFAVPDVPATFRLTESVDLKSWTIYSPEGGVIPGVTPGATNQDFMNIPGPVDGVVMYLDKDIAPGQRGGHVVDGTTILGEAQTDKDYVVINGHEYTFTNGEKFRFTIVGDQYEGQMKIEKDNLVKLEFNVLFEVWEVDKQTNIGAWVRPQGMGGGTDPVIGVPSEISITSINKNRDNEKSTLIYRFDNIQDGVAQTPTDTLLRLNGEVRIDSPNDATYLDFIDLHIVHDNRYGEGQNTMWIVLQDDGELGGGYDYILVQGECVSPQPG